MLTLKAELREKKNTADEIRASGRIPAVYYGKKEASTPISVNQTEFVKAWNEAGESTVVTLETPDGKKDSLIHHVDVDPISSMPRHADFYVFEKGHKVEVELPIEFEGVSKAVKELGGVLVKVTLELRVEAMPKDLPHGIVIDVSTLNEIGDQVLAGDIALPEGVSLVDQPDEVLVTVAGAREELEEEAAPVDLSEIEVAKKGKDEESAEDKTETEASA
jgi:large subunit ribosomal protein L25